MEEVIQSLKIHSGDSIWDFLLSNIQLFYFQLIITVKQEKEFLVVGHVK